MSMQAFQKGSFVPKNHPVKSFSCVSAISISMEKQKPQAVYATKRELVPDNRLYIFPEAFFLTDDQKALESGEVKKQKRAERIDFPSAQFLSLLFML